VNYPRLAPQSQLALFALIGLTLCFLNVPAARRLTGRAWRALDLALVLATVVCFGYVFVQTEPAFQAWWSNAQSLGNRAGHETTADTLVGIAGLALVMEAARRTLGNALPVLAGAFLAYGWFGPHLPAWLFPHRGYGVDRLVAQTFLHTQGVFGVALNVMFVYVFLFVVFGAFLQATGATRFIIGAADRLFRRSPGGPAKVAVVSSGLMGSLSGSAVANAATIGTFTIPMMRSAGFRRDVAAGIEAAASSGGALMPPVMGAGAYMMLEIVQPPVTYLEIIRAALIPAILYYLSLLFIVHFHARRLAATADSTTSAAEAVAVPPAAKALGAEAAGSPAAKALGAEAAGAPAAKAAAWFEGAIFFTSLVALVALLLVGYTPFRAVTVALVVVIAIAALHPRTRLGWRAILEGCERAARDVVPLVAAAASVGIVIGVVTLTGVGTRLPATIVPLAEQSVVLALLLIMITSIVLGMGLPSAVVYLLLATLIGPVLGSLGVVPLAAHLFIFYFGMMAMVTPPVALAAYVAASIAGADIMKTGWQAFRFALVGFTLPFIFVFRPELLMLAPAGGVAPVWSVAYATAIALAGVVAFATSIAGFLFARVTTAGRVLFAAAAALLLAPGQSVDILGLHLHVLDASGLLLLTALAVGNWRGRAS